LENNNLPMVNEVLTEAIDCVKAEKIWKIGVCYQCEERIVKSDSESLFFEHLHDHLFESIIFKSNSKNLANASLIYSKKAFGSP
jgi:hypothetical protein